MLRVFFDEQISRSTEKYSNTFFIVDLSLFIYGAISSINHNFFSVGICCFLYNCKLNAFRVSYSWSEKIRNMMI